MNAFPNNENSDPKNGTISAADAQTALEWCAVLESQDIEFSLRRSDLDESERWVFELSPETFPRAEREIRDYENERSFFIDFRRLSEEPPEPLRISPAIPIIAFSAILAFFHVATDNDDRFAWLQSGELTTAKSEIFQWWRPITALTLHADAPHILGNALFAIFFGGMLALEIGGGAVLAVALISGALGNATSLWFNCGRGYSAIGYSTAVFGMLGAMAALRMRSKMPSSEKFTLRYWLPLSAAVALLGITGSGPGSDLTGHLFGFFWGCVIGCFSANLAKFRDNIVVQALFIIFSAATFIVGWIAALSSV
ncbi:MAG: rhomboid family intramembrane serine protease [Victivallales bacterium]|nr:rhomboid family intramembrane serine protease [Victivallales bacterium]